MLFCSHAVETTVETGLDLATSTSSDSKVSGFDRPHVSEKISDSKVSTQESGFKSFHSGKRIQKFPLWRADSKVSGFAGRIHRMRVDGRRIRKEKYTDSKVSGYIWTGPDTVKRVTHVPTLVFVFVRVFCLAKELQIYFFVIGNRPK